MNNYEDLNITITKENISTLPIEAFEGDIKIVETEDEATSALKYLQESKIIGFDTETRPSYRKGKMNKVSLIQLSSEDKAFLFRINKFGFSKSLISFLSDENILKIGLSTHDDFNMLHKITPFLPAGFIELQQYVKSFGIQDLSLQKIYAIVFGKRISKTQRLTNWEANELSPAQMKYAATDAWACVKIYKALSNGSFSPLNYKTTDYNEE